MRHGSPAENHNGPLGDARISEEKIFLDAEAVHLPVLSMRLGRQYIRENLAQAERVRDNRNHMPLRRMRPEKSWMRGAGIMKHEDALILRAFKNHCTCGGYAWHLNARNPANPHFDWCPQRHEYQEWWEALHESPSHEVPDFEGIQECFMNEKAENRELRQLIDRVGDGLITRDERIADLEEELESQTAINKKFYEAIADNDRYQEIWTASNYEARIARLQARLETMIKWLMLIDGGDNPCTDIDLLRKYAMLALRGEEPPNE